MTGRAELEDLCRACADAGAELMLQEFIPGGPGEDWFFHGYCDASSACRPAFTGLKERSYPAHAGLTSLGRSVPNTRLRDQVTGLLSRLGYRGILDLDLRFDQRDGQYKLLDFNPRLGAQFRLFRDTAGLDVVTAEYIDLTGGTLPDGEQVLAGGSWSRTTTPSARSATGAAASSASAPGWRRCGRSTRSPGSRAMTCGRSA